MNVHSKNFTMKQHGMGKVSELSVNSFFFFATSRGILAVTAAEKYE